MTLWIQTKFMELNLRRSFIYKANILIEIKHLEIIWEGDIF